MVFLAPDMSGAQRQLLAELVCAVADNDSERARSQLAAAERERTWTSPPLLCAAAGLVLVITSEVGSSPWEVSDDLWNDYHPEARPKGRGAWRKRTYAIQAAGCLAAGVWLDVAATESFWSGPLWPDYLAVVDLLAVIARTRLQLSSADFTDRLNALLASALTPPP